MATLDCGHEPTNHDGSIATGYARHSVTQKTMCYPCADKLQRGDMEATQQFCAYIASDGKTVTTWTGGYLMLITQHGQSHNGFHGSTIHYWRATDDAGRRWYGRNGGNGMSVMMKRVGVKKRGY